MNPVIVIGIGDDGLQGLSSASRAALADATVIVGGDRHLAMLDPDDRRTRLPWSKDIGGVIARIGDIRKTEHVCVLATGDPLWHGIGARLIDALGFDAVRVLPAPGAFSLAAARMGWPLNDPMVRCVSLHALPFASIRRHLQPELKLLILSRDADTPSQLCRALTDAGFGPSRIAVHAHMGGPDEARIDTIAEAGIDASVPTLNTVAVHCLPSRAARPLSLAAGLPDDAFDHDGTITKRDVRAVTLAALAPLAGELLWDVGAGSGTVAIEWLRIESSAKAVAFERDPVRAARIRANAEALGVPALQIVEGSVPDTFASAPAPDAIFVGGGIAGNDGLLDVCLEKLPPGGRLVANAVTLEAQARLIERHAVLGGQLVRIAIAEAQPVGGLQAMKPAIDVLQWRIEQS